MKSLAVFPRDPLCSTGVAFLLLSQLLFSPVFVPLVVVLSCALLVLCWLRYCLTGNALCATGTGVTPVFF